MKKFSVIILVSLFAWAAAYSAKHTEKFLSSICTLQNLDNVLVAPESFAPVPKYGSAYWTDSIPAPMRQNFIKQGQAFLNAKWEPLDLGLFAEFRTNGNRTNYEKFIFSKRKQLGSLVMAEIMEGQGRFMPDIIKGIESLCDEAWWGIPAHYPDAKPTYEKQPLDLFNADTGSMAAWIYYMLGEPLQKQAPELYKKLGAEIEYRINDQGLSTREWWRGAAMNWNPWICSNWLACVLFAEPDRAKQIQAVQEIAESLDSFIDQYPDDGGCDEGASYWDRAGGSLLDCLVLLNLATGGAVDPAGDDKLLAIAEYIGKMNIDNVHIVDFADASTKMAVRPEWWAGAKLVGSADLMSLVADAAQRRGYFEKPSPLFRADNIAPLGRELFALADLPALQASALKPSLTFDAWLPRIQVLTARSIPNSDAGFYIAAKGGNNDESHNHNDVGSFIVYADGQPLFIDPGRATYTASTFNADRYKTWNVQSAYHNLPLINGTMQSHGAAFKAKDVKTQISKKKAQISMDIAGAYPESAGVAKWVRTITLNRGKDVAVTEKYKLAVCQEPVQLMFMTTYKPELESGRVVLSANGRKYALCYDARQLDATVEQVPIADDKIVADNWGALYRVELTAKSCAASGTIKYKITAL